MGNFKFLNDVLETKKRNDIFKAMKKMNWTAEIINDPSHDFDLYIELLENEDYRANIQRNKNGELMLRFYGENETEIPMDWLTNVLNQAKKDLGNE